MDINCLAGHGDDYFNPAKKSQVAGYYLNSTLQSWEKDKIKNKLDNWSLFWPK
jgi:hypothetical protein